MTDYTIEQELCRRDCTILFKGAVKGSNTGVIIKKLRTFCGNAEKRRMAVYRLNNEYESLQDVNITGVRRALSLEWVNGEPVLCLEYFDGLSLADFLSDHSCSITDSLQFMIKLTGLLDRVHNAGILHCDISSSNILVANDLSELCLIDFGLSCRLNRPCLFSMQAVDSLPAGNPFYMAPEKSCYTGKCCDLRSDLYALGVVFYEIISGRKPFSGDSIPDIIHAHLTKEALPLHEINPEIPPGISLIVAKLLQKNLYDRYQKTGSLLFDLQQLEKNLSKEGGGSDFIPDLKGSRPGFRNNQKIFGREPERAILKRAFENARNNKNVFLQISGGSGTGKSILVNELENHVANTQSCFIRVKLSREQQNSPYSACLNTLEQLVTNLYKLSTRKLALLRLRMMDTQANSLACLCHFSPRLKSILQIENSNSDTTIYIERLPSVLADLFCHCSTLWPASVVFWDDIQWVDKASCDFIRRLFLDPDLLHNSLLILAFRDDSPEGTAFAGKMSHLANIHGFPAFSIKTNFFSDVEVREIIAEIMPVEPQTLRRLGAVIFYLSSGQPQRVINLLSWLEEKGAFQRCTENNRWSVDFQMVSGLNSSRSEFEIAHDYILYLWSRLNSEEQLFLQKLSCLGDGLKPELLQVLFGMEYKDLYISLWPFLQHHFIYYSGNEQKFCFLHDSLRFFVLNSFRENSYESFLDFQLFSGRALYCHCKETGSLDNQLFLILSHYNDARFKLTDYKEKKLVFSLNLQAGEYSIKLQAFNQAIEYLKIAGEFLSETELTALRWKKDVFTIHLLLAEAFFFSGEIQKSFELLSLCREKARNNEQKIDVLALKTRFQENTGDFAGGLQSGHEALAILDETFPMDVDSDELKKMVALEYNDHLKQLNNHDLNCPLFAGNENFSGIHKKAFQKLKIMRNLISAAFFINPDLFSWIILRMGNIALRHRVLSPGILVNLGSVLACFPGDLSKGYQIAKRGMEQLERESISFSCRAEVDFVTLLQHLKKPFINNINIANSAYVKAVKAGEFAFASYAGVILFRDFLMIGRPLSEVSILCKKMISFNAETGNKLQEMLFGFYEKICQEFICAEPVPEEINGQLLQTMREYKFYTAIGSYCFLRAWSLILKNKYEEAARIFMADDYLPFLGTHSIVPRFCCFYSIALLRSRNLRECEKEQLEATEQKIAENLEIITQWAKSAPENYNSELFLVQAEMARYKENSHECLKFYRKAVLHAREFGLLPMEALAEELLADWWQQEGGTDYALIHAKRAINCYNAWGAEYKANDLYHNYFSTDRESESGDSDYGLLLDSSSNISNNLSAAMQASHTIAGELEFDILLEKLLLILLQNTRADICCILSYQKNVVYVEAFHGVNREHAEIFSSVPLSRFSEISHVAVHHVLNSHKPIVSEDALIDPFFRNDPHIEANKVRSLLCFPILHKKELLGIFYLENSLVCGLFSPGKLEFITMLATQTAISLTNSRLYRDSLKQTEEINKINQRLQHEIENRHFAEAELKKHHDKLEELVAKRTRKLQQANEKLEAEIIIRNKLEDELQKSRFIAEEANRAKTDFLAFVSHEIRTPMNSVLGLTDFVLKSGELSAENQECLSMVIDSSRHLLGMISEILDYSAVETGRLKFDPSDFDLPALLESLRRNVGFQAISKGLNFEVSISPEVCTVVFGDPKRILQILLNLVGNAVRFTSQGTVSVTVYLKSNDWLGFSVRDTGIGIPQHLQQNIFSEFVQLPGNDELSKGHSGLGLAISCKLVEMMGGVLEVESTVNLGSHFFFSIPYAPSQQQIFAEEQKKVNIDSEANMKYTSCTVLAVDDNPLSLFGCQLFLQKMGHRYFLAKSGREALDILYQEKIDLVLLDYELEDMDGGEIARQIRQLKTARTSCNIPLIGISAHASPSFRQKCMDSGMNDLLSKPFVYEELENIIAKYTSNSILTAPLVLSVTEDRVPEEKMGFLSEEGNEKILDPAAVAKYVLADTEHYQGLLKHFLSSATAFYDELFKLSAKGDGINVRKMLHSLRFSTRTIGATRLYRLASNLEETLDSSGLDYIKSGIPKLETELSLLKIEIKQFLSSSKGENGL
jgi:signal transduction histidine kinase/serine/threonine protein kinase/DNA-binding NarL/FixJ family response regulator